MSAQRQRGRSARARLGAHMSVEGGLDRAVDRAEEVDATALQIFVKSARQWKARPLDDEAAERFVNRLAASDLAPYTAAHASYLINLAAADPAVRARSIEALGDEIDRCARLTVPWLVLHPGSHVGRGEEAGLETVVASLDRVLRERPETTVTVLLENTAGQGTNLGHAFEHLGRILEQSEHAERLGVCFDTCHALAAGHEIRDAASYRKTMSALGRAVGLERIRLFHLNDSKHALGSRKDRHEHIGDGEVGLEAFRLLINDRRFKDVGMVLETPKGADLGEDRRNLAVLRQMLPESRR